MYELLNLELANAKGHGAATDLEPDRIVPPRGTEDKIFVSFQIRKCRGSFQEHGATGSP